MMKLFEELISPESLDSFFNNYWTKKELFLKKHFNASILFSMDNLNSLINTNFEHLSFPVIRLVKNGKIIPESKYTELVTKRRQTTSKQILIDKIIDFCNNGATFTFNGINNYSSILSDYCINLSNELNETTQINCYLTQKNNQGFEPHYDHHEIFIIQIEGEKEWELFGTVETFPLQKNNHYFQGEPDYKNKRGYTLSEGDVLYIPRGMWHQARTTNNSSLHLTLNIMCSLKIDYIHWLFDEITKSEVDLRKNFFTSHFKNETNSINLAIELLTKIKKNDSNFVKKFNELKFSKKGILPFNK